MACASLFLHFLKSNRISFLYFLIIGLLSLSSLVLQQALSQQTYVSGGASAPAPAPAGCTREVDTSPGYTNNGVFGACHAFLTFRAAGPYRSVRSISQLFKTEPSLVSVINGGGGGNINISETTVLEVNQLLVVQANCSSPGSSLYYQMKVASYVTQKGDTVYSIANQVFQGLTTCRAIFDHNPTIIDDDHAAAGNIIIATGTEIMVPLRCACPTFVQSEAGIKSLMTYTVVDGDTVVDISARFEVDPGLTFKANGLSRHDNDKIYPFTTLLVPIIRTRPSMSAALQQPPSPRHDQYVTPSSPPKPKKKNGVAAAVLRYIFIILGIAGAVGLGITFKINKCTCIKINNILPT